MTIVREQRIAAPPMELQTDEIFHLYQRGQVAAAFEAAEQLARDPDVPVRLLLYRASMLIDRGSLEDAVYALIDLGGLEAPVALRADVQVQLSEALLLAHRYEEARQAAERTMALVEGHPGAHIVLARVLQQRNKHAEALKEVRAALDGIERQAKAAFPLPRYVALLFQAELESQLGRTEEAGRTYESLLRREIGAPPSAVVTMALGLSQSYMGRKRPLDALCILRAAGALDPENQVGVLDAIKVAAWAVDRDPAEELQTVQDVRTGLFTEIRDSLVEIVGTLLAEEVVPEFDLTRLESDPDHRTDCLERVAERLQLKSFDRGTLYPVHTVEDFRRWAAIWRLRDETRRIRHTRASPTQDGMPAEIQGPDPHPTLLVWRRRPPRWWWVAIPAAIVIVLGVAIAVVGQQVLSSFEGKLTRVECGTAEQTCELQVDCGLAGQERHRELSDASPVVRWLSAIFERPVEADGTITFPLTYPWGDLSPRPFEACIGRPVEKQRFSLAPFCK